MDRASLIEQIKKLRTDATCKEVSCRDATEILKATKGSHDSAIAALAGAEIGYGFAYSGLSEVLHIMGALT